MKSILIGIDGAEPALIQKWQDELPTLAKFNFCKLKSTLPPSSAPAWTSVITGVGPEKHWIYDFFYFDGEIKVVNSRYRKKPAIWNLLSNLGMKSIIVNVPVTYPPERINGVIVSGLLTPPKAKFVMPSEVEKLLKGYKMEHLIVDDLPIRIASYYYPEKVLTMLNEWMEWRTKAVLRLISKYGFDFCMVVYRATDLAQHFLDDEYVYQIYKKVDEEIEKIMGKVRANYFVVSDHGFCRIRKNININNFLYDKGFLKIKKKERKLKFGKKMANLLRFLPRKFTYLPFFKKMLFSIAKKENVIDFSSSIAFCLSSSSRAILIRREYKDDVVKEIESIKVNGKRVLKLKELQYPYIKDWSYMVADLKDGYFLMDLLNFEGMISKPEKFNFKREHAKEGVFMTYGKIFKEMDEKAKITDVMPTILHSMKLPIPNYLDGKVLDIFKEKRAVRKVDWEKYWLSEKEREIIRKLALKI